MGNLAQLDIIHISDLHFGPHHFFQPETTPAGDRPDDPGVPTLLDSLQRDLESSSDVPMILCATGDVAESATVDEFESAERFFDGVRGLDLFADTNRQRVFVVPGNHDVQYRHEEVGKRWQQWCDFYRRQFGKDVPRERPWEFVDVVDRSQDLNAVVALLNSSIYVEKDTYDEDRGQVDFKQLEILRSKLDDMSGESYDNSIKIALLHHHPVLIPSLAEASRGYDAVVNSGALLQLLRKFGFHLILHGHKHVPHTFTDDTHLSLSETATSPIFIVAGGTVGSRHLPNRPGSAPAYNRIRVTWIPESREYRVRCTTRTLTAFDDDGSELLPSQWSWMTTSTDDRSFTSRRSPVPGGTHSTRQFSNQLDKEAEDVRISEYASNRGYFPVAEVLPSLEREQHYEARLWIVHHENPDREEPPPPAEELIQVIWRAGSKFKIQTVTRDEHPEFAVSYHYFGPMLVQAQLIFADDATEYAYVYARLPTDYGPR